MIDIFQSNRLAATDEPRHRPGPDGRSSVCGIPAEERPLLKWHASPEMDWDGRVSVTCIDCNPEYEGDYRRGDRNGALPKVASK